MQGDQQEQDKEPDEIPAGVKAMLTGLESAEAAQIIKLGKERASKLDEGRKKGQEAAKRNAVARRKFIEDVARAKKREFPYLTVVRLAEEVLFAIHERGLRHGFSRGRFPKASILCKIVESLGICGES